MSNERAFILGALVGASFAVVPDVVSAIRTKDERPDLMTHVYMSYGLIAIVVLVALFAYKQ